MAVPSSERSERSSSAAVLEPGEAGRSSNEVLSYIVLYSFGP